MSEKKEYPKGITFFAPRENAPKWVLGSIIISPDDLIKWLNENKHLTVDTDKYGKQYKLQVTEKGLQVDTWKPTNEYKQPAERKAAADNERKEDGVNVPLDDSLPF